jgi:hypothetical protein
MTHGNFFVHIISFLARGSVHGFSVYGCVPKEMGVTIPGMIITIEQSTQFVQRLAFLCSRDVFAHKIRHLPAGQFFFRSN